jgi:hypothetical protein
MLSVCLCIPLSSFQSLNQSFWNFICTSCTWTYLNGVLHKPFPSVCVPVCVSVILFLGKGSVNYIPPFIARQRVGKHIPAKKNTRSNRRIAGQCVCGSVCVSPMSLLGKNLMKTFNRQRRIVGGVVFYSVCVVSQNFLFLCVFLVSVSHKVRIWCPLVNKRSFSFKYRYYLKMRNKLYVPSYVLLAKKYNNRKTPTNILYAFLYVPIRAACPVPLCDIS